MQGSTNAYRAQFDSLRIQGLEQITQNTSDFQQPTLLLEAEALEQVRHQQLLAESTIQSLRNEQRTLAQSCREEVSMLQAQSRDEFLKFEGA